MRSKTVLIVEDSEAQRLTLQYVLERRGFAVYGAETVATARATAQELWENLDVVVLDMRLDDPQEPETTGADLGIEILSAPARWHPEFLIFSQYTRYDFYNLALRLGAAAYLLKSQNTVTEVIRHIRALSLRSGLNPERLSLSGALQRIAETSDSSVGAVISFCEEVLGPELDSCLGAPFALFVSNSQDTWCCTGDAPIPSGKANIYGVLCRLAETDVGNVQPFVIDAKALRGNHEDLDGDVLNSLDGAALLPLTVGQDVRICLCILKDEETRDPEDPIELASTLSAYLRPTVLHHVFKVLSQWSAEAIRRRAILRATSWAYVSVGQTQKAILPEPDNFDSGTVYSPLTRLHALSAELVDTGEMLELIGSSEVGNLATDKEEFTGSIQMAKIVRMAIEDLSDELPLNAISVEGDCALSAIPEEMYVAILRVLQFFANRASQEPQMVLPWIRVQCLADGNCSMVVFEDRSPRLRATLRQHLFSPFKSILSPVEVQTVNLHFPLFIAKALVEVRNGGTFEDRSDEIDGDLGHRFVISFVGW